MVRIVTAATPEPVHIRSGLKIGSHDILSFCVGFNVAGFVKG